MNRFLDAIPIALTPLTPVHVGCGEDFEPTNYVIDGGVLYHFEPTQLSLTTADRALLIEGANQRADAAIRAVQRFFHERHAVCRQVSRLSVPVAAGVSRWYEERVGHVAQRDARGRTVSNQLEIERTAHHPYSGTPYLPGSSLKGSMRTGWLNSIDAKPPAHRDPKRPPTERSVEIETALLGGTFASDPFRLVNVADASKPGVKSRVVFAVDRRKRSSEDGREKNLFVRREAICAGQLRGLHGEIRFRSIPNDAAPQQTPSPDRRIADFPVLAQACNRFYLKCLRTELRILRGLHCESWAASFEKVIESLAPALDDGRAMLLRVGRHSGAESVTLDALRWIRIIGGRGQDHWAREATTIWLAAEYEDSVSDLRPFGWLLIERADALLDDSPLGQWCEAEAQATASSEAESSAKTQAPPPRDASGVTVWPHAQLRYNSRNGTLTAVGPGQARANAFGERAQAIISRLPQQMKEGLRANRRLEGIARVRGYELVDVEAGL
jgi:CRISPR-associated protein Csm5